MCLDVLDKNKPKWRVGYKVFTQSKNGKLHSEIFDRYPIKPTGEWIKDLTQESLLVEDYAYESVFYPSGFHVFRYKQDAKTWSEYRNGVVKKVKLRGGVAQGKHVGNVVVGVFKEMFIFGKEDS